MTKQQLECIAEILRRNPKLGQPTIPSYESAFPTIGVDFGNIDASKEIGMLQGYAYAKREMEDTQAPQRVKYVDTDTAAQVVRYVCDDIKQTAKMCKEMSNMLARREYFEIKKVIFNAPATIVFWMDGTKTVVQAQKGDKFDPEKGLAMAFTKRALGDKGNYYNVFRKHLPKAKVVKKAGKKTNNDLDFARGPVGASAVGVVVNKPKTTKKTTTTQKKTKKEG